jgi:hypothetical protein
VNYNLYEGLFPPGHPYRHSTIGSMEDLNAAALEDVHQWFRDYYGPNNAVLSLAGDIDVETAREKVAKYFGDIPAGPHYCLVGIRVPAFPGGSFLMFGPWPIGKRPAPSCLSIVGLLGSSSCCTTFAFPDSAASRSDWARVKFCCPVSLANSPRDGYPGCFGSIAGFAEANVAIPMSTSPVMILIESFIIHTSVVEPTI